MAFCRDCFLRFFVDRVKKTIDKFRLFKSDARILVAVSGGKDSLALWDVLNRLGYPTHGLFIDLGIKGYSEDSEGMVRNFAKLRGLDFSVVRIDAILGADIEKIARKVRRPICSICGMIKRYLLNQYALKNGFDVIATGHNLDDEAATLFGNILNWQIGYLSRQAPRLESREGLIARAKPLVLISERESAAYAFLSGIEYQIDDCPHSKGATSIFYKGILNRIESVQPATKLRFYKGFLKNWDKAPPPEEMKPCSECGYPTTAGICSFCRLKKRVLSEAGS